MRFILHANAPATAATPSAMLSVVVHVALIGAAVYGTEVESRQLAEEVTQRVFFMPPPDRRPATEAVVERLQYVDVGNIARVTGTDTGSGPSVIRTKSGEDAGDRDVRGVDVVDQLPQVPFPSADSVYSMLDVEEIAVRSEGSAAPAYPPELLTKGVEGSVLTNFVVDTTGRADTSTIDILEPAHRLFVESVRTAIPGMRFSAAMVQGRKVRQMVEQRFQFRVTPPVSAPAEHTRTNPVP